MLIPGNSRSVSVSSGYNHNSPICLILLNSICHGRIKNETINLETGTDGK